MVFVFLIDLFRPQAFGGLQERRPNGLIANGYNRYAERYKGR